jgi:hypothetical protein
MSISILTITSVPSSLGRKRFLRGFSGKIGAQYEFPLGNSYSVVLGGTYRLASSIGGDVEHLVTAISGSTTDTLRDVTGDNGGILISGRVLAVEFP